MAQFQNAKQARLRDTREDIELLQRGIGLHLQRLQDEKSTLQALDDLGGDGGVFVVLEDAAEGTFEVLAKATSIWAGESLLNLIANTLRKPPRLTLVS